MTGIRHNTLRSVVLRSSSLSKEQLTALSEALKVNTTVHSVDFSGSYPVKTIMLSEN